MLFNTPIRSKTTTGEATLDFGLGSKTAEVVVTGISNILTGSIVYLNVKIEVTADHAIDDLLIDPIQVSAHSIVAGVGFTLHGEMLNAPANGSYKAQWALR